MVDDSESASQLVRIDSCLDPPRADLVQMALAREGIPTALGNVNFLSWFWHYSNAVGGVPIFVRRCEAERARDVLAAARANSRRACRLGFAGPAAGVLPGDGLPAGNAANGQMPRRAASLPATQGCSRRGPLKQRRGGTCRAFFVAASAGVLTILLVKRGLQLPAICAPFVLAVYFLLRRFEPRADSRPEAHEATEPGSDHSPSPPPTESWLSHLIVRRAWQAGVLGILRFPPLGFYSMRLLWKLSRRNTPLSRADTLRCGVVFCFNIVSIALCLLFIAAFF